MLGRKGALFLELNVLNALQLLYLVFLLLDSNFLPRCEVLDVRSIDIALSPLGSTLVSLCLQSLLKFEVL